MPESVKMYTLSTCSHCKATKRFMNELNVPYEFTDVDLLTGDERQEVIAEVTRLNPNRSFPTIIIGERIIVGFNEKAIREALGL
ncbi:MAG TPA: glutaredoxin family protein [Syntrophales bacterium]|nr:glutaredoxin family protein [Syntrophales bacterium]HOM07443.1 glutaredoxin family protein [Syntrophales bacterium]HON99932.1 glutaredoxin family protein [Syntrophales bacterium]HPC01414.1 glutaredoxin family protein [Syntrophales bacterium]HPQ06954.1 glutaredoxin family protein [Syntrophales bacterium]